MSLVKPGNKVHTYIGNPRSLCGLAPKNGQYNIVDFQSFFTASDENQCGKCLEALRRRGYRISDLRKKYRAIYDRAIAHGAPGHFLPA